MVEERVMLAHWVSPIKTVMTCDMGRDLDENSTTVRSIEYI